MTARVEVRVRTRIIEGPITSDIAPDRPSIVMCSSPETLELRNLSNVLALVCDEWSADSHITVILKIKGIPIVPMSAVVVEGFAASIRVSDDVIAPVFAEGGSPTLQVSIFDPSDAGALDSRHVKSVFVRAEHVLLGRLSTLTVDDLVPTVVERTFRNYLDELVEALDPKIDVLFRGLDIRSDDPIARLMGRKAEPNPDLGEHGLRSFARYPDLARSERRAVCSFDGRIQYALPFVTSSAEVEWYMSQYPLTAGERRPALFLESPSAVDAIDTFRGYDVAIGLKDVAQFYFGADRSNPAVTGLIDYTNPRLVNFVTIAARKLVEMGSRVSLYQDAHMSAAYEKAMRGVDWLRSVPLGAISPFERAGTNDSEVVA